MKFVPLPYVGGNGQDVIRLIAEDIAMFGGELGKIHMQREWHYFPRATPEALANGFFDKLDALQGHQNTFWAGSVAAGIEIVEASVDHAQGLMQLHFGQGKCLACPAYACEDRFTHVPQKII